jgi:ribosomal protein L39E
MTRRNKRQHQKKIKLGKATRQTRWAPVWVIVKKLGAGKRVHPSAVTHVKRSWTRTKLKIKPRRQNKKFLG